MDSAEVKQGNQHQTDDSNTIIGSTLLADQSISFSSDSSGNTLFCKDGADSRNPIISFNGSNSLIYLSNNRHSCQIDPSINRDINLFIGDNNYFDGKLTLVPSERNASTKEKNVNRLIQLMLDRLTSKLFKKSITNYLPDLCLD